MPPYDQRGRKVLVDEEFFRQLLAQAQMPQQEQALVPRQETIPNEYQIVDESQIIDEEALRNDELAKYVDGADELDLNRNRNEIPQGTFGTIDCCTLINKRALVSAGALKKRQYEVV